MLIYFGYPQAHEDDAERAVRAGLAVIERVGRLPVQEDLSVRLGVATRLAVVGDLIGEGAAHERGVVGETPNLAARLQALAGPNTLVIAETPSESELYSSCVAPSRSQPISLIRFYTLPPERSAHGDVRQK